MPKPCVYLTTAKAAELIGVAKSTLLRWIYQGCVADVTKDRHGWRCFTPEDVERLRQFNEGQENPNAKRS